MDFFPGGLAFRFVGLTTKRFAFVSSFFQSGESFCFFPEFFHVLVIPVPTFSPHQDIFKGRHPFFPSVLSHSCLADQVGTCASDLCNRPRQFSLNGFSIAPRTIRAPLL